MPVNSLRHHSGTRLASVVSLVLIAGCATSSSPDEAAAAGGPRLVASTNVWAQVAETVGGDEVAVVSFINDSTQDPHSYEASSNDLLAVSKATVVIANGGGYDDFMNKAIDASDTEAAVLDAFEISGYSASSDEEVNEHVWYDFATVSAVTEQIATELSTADPANADGYAERAAALVDDLGALTSQTSALAEKLAGAKIAVTEPLPIYLTQALGLDNLTPGEFAEAIEEGEDVSVATLAATERLLTERQVAALLYNEQTTGPVTEQLREAAEAQDLAVVSLSEILPEGSTYAGWMKDNLAALDAALSP